MNPISHPTENRTCRRISHLSVYIAIITLLATFGRGVDAQRVTRSSLANAKLGLFVHYVFGLTDAAPGKPPLTNVNQFADDLNVKDIADMASAMGAQFVIFTTWHYRMTILYPSKVWGGIFPSHVSKRDVIGPLAKALKAKGIKLVLYVHPDDRHDFPLPMLKKLVKAGDTSESSLKACLDFYTLLREHKHAVADPYDPKWNKLYYRLLNEIGRRYGQEIAGYWEDDGGGGSNGNTVADIMTHYTPDASMWGFNTHPPAPATLAGTEDWTDLDNNPKPHIYNTKSYQGLKVIAGSWWATDSKLQYTPAEMYRYVVCTIATEGQHNGGAVLATSPYSDNQWEPGVPAGLAALGKLIKAHVKSIYNTVPSRAYVSGEAASQKPAWGVAVDSMDGKTVYLHVLMPPTGDTLHIGKPADGVTFSSAALLNGTAVSLSAGGNGYTLTLPAGMRWSPLDTVIALIVK